MNLLNNEYDELRKQSLSHKKKRVGNTQFRRNKAIEVSDKNLYIILCAFYYYYQDKEPKETHA